MGTLVIAYLRANWIKVGMYLISGVDWASVMARAFNFVLTRAANRKSYATVRLLAKRVIEQANYILKVTDDGVINSAEAGEMVTTTRKLLTAWAEGEGKAVTAELEKIINSETAK